MEASSFFSLRRNFLRRWYLKRILIAFSFLSELIDGLFKEIYSRNILPLVDSLAYYARHVNNNGTKYDALPRSSRFYLPFTAKRPPGQDLFFFYFFIFRQANIAKGFPHSYLFFLVFIFMSTRFTKYTSVRVKKEKKKKKEKRAAEKAKTIGLPRGPLITREIFP
ncbi:hypothetical protein PUN28_016628 [Cardiocondyla obscurior]|uniref:Uncharacterized protein n=1 Tax=Cardiocondyla obscurior TaxID=286306 RepID=A0AAW2EQM8_9HYME